MGFFNKLFGKKEKESLDEGLQKTKENFFSKVSKAIAGKSAVDEEVLDNLEIVEHFFIHRALPRYGLADLGKEVLLGLLESLVQTFFFLLSKQLVEKTHVR